MFVCICKGIRKSDIEALVKDQGHGTEAIKEITGAGTDCGTCELRLQRVLKDIESKSNSEVIETEDVAG